MVTTFAFEANFDHESKKDWMAANWTLSIGFSAIYLLFIFISRKLMQRRPGFRLQRPLFVWNFALAIFSIAGTCRVLPKVISGVWQFGFRHSVCDPIFFTRYSAGFWAWLFAFSKVPELGDTVFLVLRKRPLNFLHWYHHVTVLCYSWFSYADHTSTGRWFIAMNYTVHAIMYSYYALRALPVRVPAMVSVCITALQLAQMAVGCFVNAWGYWLKVHGAQCHVTYWNMFVSTLMYASYFALFAHFFNEAYVRKGGPRKTE